MKVTLIYPAVGKRADEKYISSWKMQPLPLMTLAALTPPEIEVLFYDDRIERIDYDHSTDLVAINIEAYSALRGYHIASEFRKRGVPVIFGGYHATLMPEEASLHADSVLVGEAEGVWPEILKDVKRGDLKPLYRSNVRPAFGDLIPRVDILGKKKYTPLTLVETSRGCLFNCDFCSIASFYQNSYNYRTPESIANEIKVRGGKNVFFVDDNIISEEKRARELFKALEPLNIRWMSQFSINMAHDESLLKLMKKSGCVGVLIGFESLEEKNLKLMGKSWNSRKSYDEALEKLRDNGICVYATFLFGYDYDTSETLDRTLEFAIKHKFFTCAFNHLLPFPGTEVYGKLEREKRLLYDKWWLAPDYEYGKIIFRPKLMTPEELERKCVWARTAFHSFPSILKRGLDFKTNSSSLFLSSVFFTQNILLRREVNEKWGLPLGKNLDTDFK